MQKQPAWQKWKRSRNRGLCRLFTNSDCVKGYGKMKRVKVSNIKEKAMEIVFLISACISILSVALICIFLFTNGVPGIAKIGAKEFLLGTEWKPGSQLYGILSTIIGSIYVTVGAIIVGVSEKAVQDPETGSRTSGGNSIGSIWILWADGAGTVCT